MTDDQQSRIRAAVGGAGRHVWRLLVTGGLMDGDVPHAKLQTALDEMDARIERVLTPGQEARWAAAVDHAEEKPDLPTGTGLPDR